MRSARWFSVLLPWTLVFGACGTGSTSAANDLGAGDAGGGDQGSSACPLTGQTMATAKVTNGCAVLTRDTSACMAARTALGLTGAWLQFSCRVTLTTTATAIQAAADSQPDYTSNYFATTSPCYAAYTPSFNDPNKVQAQNLVIKAPKTPNTTNTLMGLGPVGIALNGVAIYDNQAAPGDDIFKEAGSFDRCGGHPAPTGSYHYHGEPYALSADDANLIGVLRDGYFVYGRRDADGSTPTLDSLGGHMGTTADSQPPVYHYHLNQQTSSASGTAGQKQYFLTTGTYKGNTAP